MGNLITQNYFEKHHDLILENNGKFFRMIRKSRGVKAKDLCYDICTETNLYAFESGEGNNQLANDKMTMMLLRLGYDNTNMYYLDLINYYSNEKYRNSKVDFKNDGDQYQIDFMVEELEANLKLRATDRPDIEAKLLFFSSELQKIDYQFDYPEIDLSLISDYFAVKDYWTTMDLKSFGNIAGLLKIELSTSIITELLTGEFCRLNEPLNRLHLSGALMNVAETLIKNSDFMTANVYLEQAEKFLVGLDNELYDLFLRYLRGSLNYHWLDHKRQLGFNQMLDVLGEISSLDNEFLTKMFRKMFYNNLKLNNIEEKYEKI